MKDLTSLSKIEKDLEFCNNYWTILYGSYVNQKYIPSRSDIDVAIISQTKNQQENFEIWMNSLENLPIDYDLRIFELLPLYIQIDIIETHTVIFGDPLEISEYFYHYRTIWKDMIYRYKNNQFHNIEEKLNLIEKRKKFLVL